MKSIKRKISFGFITLLAVMVLSGVISIAEMNRLRHTSETTLTKSSDHSKLSTRLLDALQKQNGAVLDMIMLNSASPAEGYFVGATEFQEAIEIAAQRSNVEAIVAAHEQYQALVAQHSTIRTAEADKLWYMESYVDAYNTLDRAIKEYFISLPEKSVAARMNDLENSIYKTITPSILTHIVTILVVLIFFFLVNTYYTSPVIKMNRCLRNYLKNNIPYQMKVEDKSELQELNNSILELVEQNKKYKGQDPFAK